MHNFLHSFVMFEFLWWLGGRFILNEQLHNDNLQIYKGNCTRY